MERFVRQLMRGALFLSGLWLWAIQSPGLATELQMLGGATPARSPGSACCPNCSAVEYEFAPHSIFLFELPDDRYRFPPGRSTFDGFETQAVHCEPFIASTELSKSCESASAKISPSAWEGVLADAYEEIVQSSALTDTPFGPQACSSSGDVAYQSDSARGCKIHLSAADLLDCAPKAQSWRGDLAFRFGWWGTSNRGAPTKVGEFQALSPSPFWDFDRLFSDGVQTVDLSVTGLDNDGNQARLYLFGPKITVGADYRRYLRRLDHDPLTNMPPSGNVLGNTAGPSDSLPDSTPDESVLPDRIGEEIVSEDLNVGEDYAIRVQRLRTYAKGRLAKNVKYRVNFWLQRRKGARQAIATQHCANSSEPGGGGSSECHVLSQTQQIDWLTTKIEPIVEARFGRLVVEYARPMRFFNQNDQVVTRSFGDWGDGHVYNFMGDFPYGLVPENVTQTDRLKVSLDLPLDSHFYGRLHTGNTSNRNRDTNRRFYGYDLRLTNQHWDRWTLTGFARMNRQSNQFPPFFVDPEEAATSDTASNGLPLVSSIVPQYGLGQPINYRRTSFGAEANWRPFRWTDLGSGLAVNFGIEGGQISRQFAQYQILEQDAFVDQNRTPYTSYFAGTSMKWAATFDTFLRYKGRATRRPLFAVNQNSGETNTNLPEHQDRIEVGGTWMPADNFIATANIGLDYRRHDSNVANFDEDSYPLTFTLWHAPTTRWSLSAGYSHLSNWIDQDIYFPSDTPDIETYDRRTWNYGGTGQMLRAGGSYAWTPCVSLSGGVQYVWARNTVGALEPWPDLPQYFNVLVNRTRVTGGVDWWMRDNISTYFRYVYEDFQDLSAEYNSGSVHMFLGGFSALY